MADMAAASGGSVEQLSPDQHAADLASPRADLIQFRIPQESARGVVVDVAVATERLDSVERARRGSLGREQDAACGIESCRLSTVAGARYRVHIGPRGVEGRVEVRDLGLHQLKGADGLTKLPTLVNVRQYGIETRLHEAKRPACQYHAFVV